MIELRKISVVGLGYVGLPVAVAFGHLSHVVGFDVDASRIQSLKNGEDTTLEVNRDMLTKALIHFTTQADDLREADFHIIAVPTPVDESHIPDLSALKNASACVGKQLKKGDIVVYESTVYPGATEEVCLPLLELHSGLKAGADFKIGYSPERINPGDNEHKLSNIVKVVSAQDVETLEVIAQTYARVVKAGIHKAPSIKIAEAAKIIENTQRDLNIALMNELSIVFEKMEIDTAEVLAAASTKWNFVPFTPGLVGGHCIGVDPYYLTYKASQLGYLPEVILAGRRINDAMGLYVAEQVVKRLKGEGCTIKGARIGVLGLTFKENCPDLRNSKVVDVVFALRQHGVDVLVHDPLASKADALKYYQIQLREWHELHHLDAIVLCVPHAHYLEMSVTDYQVKLNDARIIFDVKSKLSKKDFENQKIKVWRL